MEPHKFKWYKINMIADESYYLYCNFDYLSNELLGSEWHQYYVAEDQYGEVIWYLSKYIKSWEEA